VATKRETLSSGGCITTTDELASPLSASSTLFKTRLSASSHTLTKGDQLIGVIFLNPAPAPVPKK